MGLKYLEWHEQSNDGWVARMVIPFDTNPVRTKYRRFAHVNMFDWIINRTKDKRGVPVQFQFYKQGFDVTWHDDIDSAKLHVEAIFALMADEIDSLDHWR
jgi:lipid II:glycine glycyltransferase (peptidoglycan interpeptide bridge formation enzyme)